MHLIYAWFTAVLLRLHDVLVPPEMLQQCNIGFTN